MAEKKLDILDERPLVLEAFFKNNSFINIVCINKFLNDEKHLWLLKVVPVLRLFGFRLVCFTMVTMLVLCNSG